MAKQLQDVKDQRSLPPEPFKRLRSAWTTKRDEIERESPCVDAEYEEDDVEDVERAAISEAS